jgi:hypothetical protein
MISGQPIRPARPSPAGLPDATCGPPIWPD